jgi:membrane protein implicated in regulation of membrane protease activity
VLVFLILAIALLLFLSSPWNFVGFAACLVLFFGELGLWHRSVRGRRQVVGAQALIGAEALVTQPCRPDGQVRISGELWEARCEEGADTGETVRVNGRNGLKLLVERVS